jgi:outer membrane protein assembly factor BamD (BamD/ComL family)
MRSFKIIVSVILIQLISHQLFAQDRKLQKCYEYIQAKEFTKAEEIISQVSSKASDDPKVFYVLSKLCGAIDYANYNVDSCFIYYSESIELLSSQESKELEEICTDFKLCLYDSRRVKDSIAAVAFTSYKISNSVGRMEEFKKLYEGTSSIQAANVFIEELHYQSAQQLNTVEAYNNFLSLYPTSSKKETIELKIHELEFQRVSALNDKVEYGKYISTYPTSKYKADVLKQIELLDFESLKNIVDLNAFETFLTNYPNSSYKKDLLNLYETPYFEHVNGIKDLSSLNNFKKRYPDSKKVALVDDLICEINYDVAKVTNTREAYKKFIKDFPNSKYEIEAQNKISELFPHVPKLMTNGKYKYVDKFNGNTLIETQYDEAPLFENDQAIVKQNGYMGVIDENGKVIVPFSFDEISRLTNTNFYLVGLNEKYGLYNNEGQKLLNTEFSNAYYDTEEMLGFNRYNNDWDYYSNLDYTFKIQNNNIVKYSLPYDYVPYFTDGFAVVTKGQDYDVPTLGLYSIINTSFEEIIPFKYNYIEQVYEEPTLFIFNVGGEVEYYGEGLYPASGKWGVVNHQGKVIIPAVFDELRSIILEGEDGNKIYFVANRGKNVYSDYEMELSPGNYGVIDEQGNEIIPFEYQQIYSGNQNQLVVNKGGNIEFDPYGVHIFGGKWGVIDLKNQVRVPIIYDDVLPLGKNYIVRKDAKIKEGDNGSFLVGGKYGVVNENNVLLVPFSYDYIEAYNSDSLIYVVTGCKWLDEEMLGIQGGKWGAVNQKGQVVFTLNFDEIYSTDSNFIILETGREYGTSYPGEIKKYGKKGLADLNAKLILPIKYDEIQVGTNFIYATLSGKKQIFLKNGSALSGTLYDELYELNEGYIAYRIGEKNGILKPDGSVLFPAMFWSTKTEFYYSYDIQMEGDLFKINEGGTVFYANKKGEIFKE